MVAKISIIVPVYNVEKYIRRCIDSLIAQTFEKIEILLIDDGSKDSSGTICDEYALKDNRIKVIHKENGGVSSARNAGLDSATGTYIMFCDPDDYVEPTWCERLYRSIIRGNFYSACGYKIVDTESTTIYADNTPHFSSEKKTSKNSECLLFLYSYGLFKMIWNAIFDINIIKNYGIRFREEYSRCEDTLFAIEYLLTKEGNINFVEESLYLYTRGAANSLTSKIPNNYWSGELSWLKKIKPLMLAYNIEFDSYKNKYYSQVLYAIVTALNGITSEQEKLSTILKKEREIFKAPECIEVLKKGNLSEVNAAYAAILRTRNGFLVWLFHWAVKLKHWLVGKNTYAKR